jgi:hypothetical protein
MEKYKTLIVKMSQKDPSIYQARLNFDILFHIHMPFDLVLFIAIVGGSQCFNQICSLGRDVFICDFVTTIFKNSKLLSS